MAPHHFSRSPLLAVLAAAGSARAALPYNPWRVVEGASRNGPSYYILEPPSPAAAAGRLLEIDLSSTIDNSTLGTNVVSSSLPFLEVQASQPYTLIAATDGSLAAFTGNCGQDATNSALWMYNTSTSTSSWQTRAFTLKEGTNSAVGSQYLASGLSFSFTVGTAADLYVFGGMCPEPGASDDDWTSAATYSGSLLSLDAGAQGYTLASTIAQPTPEAGFSLTPLGANMANLSDGTTTQQQNFVLIGGHTSSAFIDMNMVALFSLPQSSWTFLAVTDPGPTDLAARQTTTIEPRSGHTAVLSQDGSQIVVFGGWVGDVNTAAQPQLAVLEVGAGYGGAGAWTWSASAPSPLSNGNGIYGHGAIMLPGNIMLVTGGFSITGSPSKAKRADSTLSTPNYFFNVTSGQWIDSYNVAAATPSPGQSTVDGGHSGTQKAGLGAGLGVGLAVLIGLIICSVWYYRKLKKRRQQRTQEIWGEREKEIDELANSAHRGSTISNDHDQGNPFITPDEMRQTSYPWTYGDADNSANGMRDAQRSGVFVDIPSPQRGLRRSMHSRSLHSAPKYDDGRLGFGGDMDAIQERDEEASNTSTSREVSGNRPASAGRVPPAAARISPPPADPFADPTLASTGFRQSVQRRPISPLPEPHQELSALMLEYEAPGSNRFGAGLVNPALPASRSGRTSPSKSERTRSDLSEGSVYSSRSGNAFGPSRQTSAKSLVRDYLPSLIPAAIANSFGNGQTSPTFSGPPSIYSNSELANSYATAKTTFSQLQAESEALLGSHGVKNQRPNSSGKDQATDVHLEPDTEPTFSIPRTRANSSGKPGTSPTSTSPTRVRRPSLVGTWVGSVKRNAVKALTSSGSRSVSVDSSSRTIGADGYYDYGGGSTNRRSDLGGLVDLASLGGIHPALRGGLDSHDTQIVRRVVSDSLPKTVAPHAWTSATTTVTVTATASGADPGRPPNSSHSDKSWASKDDGAATGSAVGSHVSGAPSSSGSGSRGTASGSGDDEFTLQDRIVQFMYTVPRERLRVVNADVSSESTE